MARFAIHPGEHLAEELKELDITAAGLARQLKVPTNRVTGILNGQRAITGGTALRLGHFFGTSPEFWLNLRVSTNCASPSSKQGGRSGLYPPSSAGRGGACDSRSPRNRDTQVRRVTVPSRPRT